MSPRNAPPPSLQSQPASKGTAHPPRPKTKGWSKQLTAKPEGWIKASTQQGVRHICSPFHTVPADAKWTWCHWWCQQ